MPHQRIDRACGDGDQRGKDEVESVEHVVIRNLDWELNAGKV